MTSLITTAFSLFLLMYSDYSAKKKKAEAEDTEFNLDKATLAVLVNDAVEAFHSKNAVASAGDQAAMDAADEDLKK